MNLDRTINIDDLRKLAKRRLPRLAYDFIEGGLEDERGVTRNESAFTSFDLVPRYGIDVTAIDQSTMLFGRTYSGPLGIAPTGLAALFRPGADLMLAQTAKAANVPFIMSGASTALIEDLGRVAAEHGWYQLYVARDRGISEDMIRRVRDAGLSTLVITVDVPTNSKRERNLRNGFTRPIKPTLSAKLEALLHPAWMAEYLRTGTPMLSNWQRYAPPGASATEVAEFVAQQMPVPVLWRDIENFRRLWPGKLVVKGIMHPDDATRCAALGVDGIMVSNHGGRQLDKSPGADRGAASHRGDCRREDGRDVRQRHPPRLGRHRGAVPRRQVRVRRPADALRGRRRWRRGRLESARDLQGRDRPHHGADGRARHPQPGPAVPHLGT